MSLIGLCDKSMSKAFPVSDRSMERMDVMELLATVTWTRVAYCRNPVGRDVSWLPHRSKLSTGVVAGVLAMTVPIAVLSIPWSAQEIVRTVLPPTEGWHVHGEMESTGHLQFNAVSEVNGVTAESPQVALATMADKVGSEMSHPTPPPPVVAPWKSKMYLEGRLLRWMRSYYWLNWEIW